MNKEERGGGWGETGPSGGLRGQCLCWGRLAQRTGALVGGRARTAPPAGPAPVCPGQYVSLSLLGAGLEGRWPRAKALTRDQSSGFQVTRGSERALSSKQRWCPGGGSRSALRLCREPRAMEQPWNWCLSLLSGKVELRVAKPILSSLAWGRERTHWNLLPEDAHSDLGRESNSRTGAVFRSPGCPLLLAPGTWGAEARTRTTQRCEPELLNKPECGSTSVCGGACVHVCAGVLPCVAACGDQRLALAHLPRSSSPLSLLKQGLFTQLGAHCCR